MRSKYGQPKAKFGQIKVQYGYSRYDGEDHFMCYGGHEGSRRDARLLMHAINEKRYCVHSKKYEKSLIEELEERGYDIKTLKISIEKKEQNQ